MKTCSYCGQETADEVVNCPGCGTQFVAPPDEGKPRGSWDWSWMRPVCAYVGAGIVSLLLYLLSFGPVLRCSTVVISQSSWSNATNYTVQRTVRLPGWVQIVYYPAVSLTFGAWANAEFVRPCQSYIEWWQPQPPER